ncbi:MAG TPA: recombinase family protein [Kineosporiaceae bacterium]|nr:recombinase family protein [Kineosporiaceae bacterium]
MNLQQNAVRPVKIRPSHLGRVAAIYVRQSTMAQVRDHTESTARQYGLAGEAVRLGWPEQLVEVIDADLGLSGSTATGREGFKALVARVCLGEIGAIFGLEVSRLSRSNADFARLLELARLTDTLLVDAEGVYDLSDYNDMLLLGLKGTISAAELHVIVARLQGAKRAAAGRGDLRTPLPVGYVRDEDLLTVIDPDAEVAAAIADVFTAFAATGSAYQVVGAFTGRRFPLRAYGGAWAGQLRWGRLTHARVLGILTNPCYAGTYVFGRYASAPVVHPDGGVHTRIRRLPMDDWKVVIHDHHPGYLTWDQYLANQAQLAANRTNAGARPVREGHALCQGIIYCGSCGRPMTVNFHGVRGQYAGYECSRSRADHHPTATCRSITAAAVDTAVTAAFLAAITSQQIDLAIHAADQVTDRQQHATRAGELAVTRARYEADRAERALAAVEPENRLVAATLEQRWETKLAALAEAQTALAATRAAQPPLPSPGDLHALAADLPRLWDAATTSDRDRKRLLRTLIADVTILPEPDPGTVVVGLRWHTGATDRLTVARPLPSGPAKRTPGPAIDLIRELAATTSNDDIAARLNAAGHLTGRGRPYDAKAVSWARHAHHLPHLQPLPDGEITVTAAARRLAVSIGVIYYWIEVGQLAANRHAAGRIGIPWNRSIEAECRGRIYQSGHLTPKKTTRRRARTTSD